MTMGPQSSEDTEFDGAWKIHTSNWGFNSLFNVFTWESAKMQETKTLTV